MSQLFDSSLDRNKGSMPIEPGRVNESRERDTALTQYTHHSVTLYQPADAFLLWVNIPRNVQQKLVVVLKCILKRDIAPWYAPDSKIVRGI